MHTFEIFTIFGLEMAKIVGTCSIMYGFVKKMKMAKSQIDTFLREQMTMAHWIRLSLLCVGFVQTIPDGPLKLKNCPKQLSFFRKILGTTSVDQTTRLRRVIGCLQTPVLGRRCGLRRFFSAKKAF